MNIIKIATHDICRLRFQRTFEALTLKTKRDSLVRAEQINHLFSFFCLLQIPTIKFTNK